jgi:putative FmdB family regulatory protein
MPMYVYVCSECNHSFEEISNSVAAGKNRLEDVCPECGTKHLTRPITLNKPTIHLRGYSPAHPRFYRGMRGR